MIKNEYVMTRNRYLKWTMPKFYALPIFYIYIVLFVLSILGLWYFINHNATRQTVLLFIFISLAIFYLAVFHKWVVAISQYKVLYKKVYKGELWKCKVYLDNQDIKLYVNDELTNEVSWKEITMVAEAKSFVSLKRNTESEKIVIFDDSYTNGSREELLRFIKTNFSNIPIGRERIRYNK